MDEDAVVNVHPFGGLSLRLFGDDGAADISDAADDDGGAQVEEQESLEMTDTPDAPAVERAVERFVHAPHYLVYI